MSEHVTTIYKPDAVPSREEMLARAREIAPLLRARSRQCDADRRVPIETVEDYRRLGLIRMSMPTRYNGYELGWDILCEVTQILAAACGSQAWIQRICAGHAQLVATFLPEAQEDVWGPDPDVLISAAFDPVGRAKRVDGGYIYSGRHGFSSGIDHAGWMICGGFIEDGDKLDGPHFFLVPREDATIIDDWHTIGLSGTGSKSFEVKDAFVPGHRFLNVKLARDGNGPGTKVNTAPVYRTPRGGITTTGFAALTVGMAKGVMAEWYAYTRPRKSRGVPVGKQEGTQIMAALSHAEIDAAEALYLHTIRGAMRKLERHEPFSQVELATSTRNVGYACQLALTASTRLVNAGGGRLLFEDNHVTRQFRNVLGGASHHGVNWEKVAKRFGAIMLEEQTPSPVDFQDE